MFLACDVSNFLVLDTDILYDFSALERIPLSSSVLHDTMINALTSINSLQTKVFLQRRQNTTVLGGSDARINEPSHLPPGVR